MEGQALGWLSVLRNAGFLDPGSVSACDPEVAGLAELAQFAG